MHDESSLINNLKITTMFKNSKVFSSFSVNDIQKAKEFYGNTLGVEVKDNPMGVIELHLANGNEIMLYPKPNHEPATFTVLNFIVNDIEKAVDELSAKDVKFEQYKEKDLETDEKGISKNPDGPKIAWFKDPAGNILSVIQEK